MPAETVLHQRCWMAWPARRDIWGNQLEVVRRDIARLANTIAQFEPVTMAVRAEQRSGAAKLLSQSVTLWEVAVDDLWARDSGPSFLVRANGGLAGSTWNFNGWGNKQPHAHDAKLAGRILAHEHAQRFDAPIVTEGGALEVDGDGTLICTETSILNPNRNPGMTREEAETILMGWLGVSKVVWLPDHKPDYWTDGHIDGYLKFIRPGELLFELTTDPHEADYQNVRFMLHHLEQQTDARGRQFKVTKLYRPLKYPKNNPNFCDCYINFYLPNGGVVMCKFGDEERDALARATVANAFPSRQVVQIEMNAVAGGGGSIHCSTQQEPAPFHNES